MSVVGATGRWLLSNEDFYFNYERNLFMYTLNLGVVFSRSNVVAIIVCASENPIDKEAVSSVVLNQLRSSANQSAVHFFKAAINAVKNECGCDAVLVNADCACQLLI